MALLLDLYEMHLLILLHIMLVMIRPRVCSLWGDTFLTEGYLRHNIRLPGWLLYIASSISHHAATPRILECTGIIGSTRRGE